MAAKKKAKRDRIEMSWMLAASPKRVYEAWLDSDEHAAMTGGGADIDPRVGGAFTAWDGYIEGVTKKLEKNRRIVQTWRTAEWKRGARDSLLDIELVASRGETQLILRHSGLVPGDGAKYTVGWYDNYLVPMTSYFTG